MDSEVDAVFTQISLQIQENTKVTTKQTPKQPEPVQAEEVKEETVTVEAEEVPPVVSNTPKTDMKVVKDEAEKIEPEPVKVETPQPEKPKAQEVPEVPEVPVSVVEYTAKSVGEMVAKIDTIEGLTDLYNRIKAVQNVGPFLNILGGRRKEINSQKNQIPQNA